MKKMSLLEKYQKGFLKEGDYIGNFSPDKATITISKEKSGWEEDQVISTEDLRYQFAGFFRGNAVLLSDSVTKQKIYLSGREGYYHGVNILMKVMKKCYSSKRFLAKGFILTQRAVKKIPENLKKDKEGIYDYWLGNQSKITITDIDDYYGILFVDRRKSIYADPNKIELATMYVWPRLKWNCCFHIRPAVYLPSKTLIDKDNNIVLKKQK